MLLGRLSRSLGGRGGALGDRSRSIISRRRSAFGAAANADANADADAPSSSSLAPFIAQIGEKSFTCTQCGMCCTGSGDVWATEEEVRQISARTKKPAAAFTKTYSRATGWRLLRDRPPSNSGRVEACIFLGPDDKTCTIHDVRPKQCSLYPWWPGLMDAKEWAVEKNDICEGFDHEDAPPTDVVAAAEQLREATKLEAMRLASYVKRRGNKKRRGGDEEDEDVGFGGARTKADLPVLPSVDGGGVFGGSSKKDRAAKKKGALYDRLMALLQDENNEG